MNLINKDIQSNQVPKLRFPEFEGEWKIDKLVNFSTLQRGFDLTKATRNEGEYPVYSSSGIAYYHSEYKTMGPGIVTGRKGIIGKVFYVEGNFWPHDTTLWVNDFHGNYPNFVYWFLITLKLEKHDASTSVPTLNRNNIHGIKISFPTLPEQQKIAAFLSAVDKKIEQLTCKKELLEKYKKGVMQKIFSQEIRFKDENGKDYPDWEEKRLGDICKIRTGKLDANAMKENGQYRFYTCAKEFYMIDDFAFNTEALLVSGNGANVGYIHYYKGKFNAYQRTYVLDQFIEIIQFIKRYLEKYLAERINREKNDGNTPYITLSTLSDMMIRLPKKEEQKIIASFLSNLDKKIEAIQHKITKTQAFKKGLLRQMFV